MFRLRELRLENGMKRSDLSRLLNIPASTLANYENESRQAPYEYLRIFAEFFDVTVDYLLGEEESAKNCAHTVELLLSQKERELISLYRACDERGRARIFDAVAEIVRPLKEEACVAHSR